MVTAVIPDHNTKIGRIPSLINKYYFEFLTIDIWQHELTSFIEKDANYLSEHRKIIKG
jgi:hypothetical protein